MQPGSFLNSRRHWGWAGMGLILSLSSSSSAPWAPLLNMGQKGLCSQPRFAHPWGWLLGDLIRKEVLTRSINA